MSYRKRKRVLFLYADTGAGHRSVAAAICAALREIAGEGASIAAGGTVPYQEASRAAPGLLAALHDPIAGCKNAVLGVAFDLYAPLTRHAPRVFTAAYRVSDADLTCRLVRGAMHAYLHGHLLDVIESHRPDLVVCVHSLLTYPILRAMRHANCAAPLFMVVTDLASIHRSWVVPEVDRCFVPTAEARAEMIARGMPHAKMRQSGLPIHPAYSIPPAEQPREALRLSLGLHPELFTVLIAGGGEGVGRLDDISRDLARSGLPIQLIVVAGRNQALQRSLNARREQLGVPHKVHGYARNMPELIRASNVIVTKAGSVTIAEALASGLPIVLSSVIEGQESGNVDFVLRNGVGYLARTGAEVVSAVKALLELDEQDLLEMSNRALRLSAPSAAFEVAEQILEALELGTIDEADPAAVP
jgi:UDP-N-acetylglucosamine:LPS N-acetylglucosamine transferase